MIIREDRSWLRLVFYFRSGTIIDAIWVRFLAVVAFSVVLTFLYEDFGYTQLDLTTAPFAIVGLALSIFLGFRNGACYDRFWEARKLWGRFVNSSRSIARQLHTISHKAGEHAWQKPVADYLIAYIHAMKWHLRDGKQPDELGNYLSTEDLAEIRAELNPPHAILRKLMAQLASAYRQGDIDSYHHVLVEEMVHGLTDIQGGCERIKSTPVPLSHTALTHRMVAAYVWTTPFGLLGTLDYATPVIVALVAFSFFGLDALGEELEDPFGTDCNDLPLNYLATMIETNIRETMGDTKLPTLPQPNDSGVLL